MEKNKITTRWVENMQLSSDNPSGENFLMNGAPEIGGIGEGLRPKALMLSALAGCTGIDIASLFKKMKIEDVQFYVEVEGVLSEEHPKIYHTVQVDFHFTGNAIPAEKIEKIIQLTTEKYCGVMAMFRGFAKVTHQVYYHSL